MSFAEGDEDDEKWLKAHKKEHDKKPVRRKRTPRQRGRPIQVGSVKKNCKNCGEGAAVELFRNGRCLACQVADYLGPME